MIYFDDFRENISRIQEGRSAVDKKAPLSGRSIFSAAFLPHQKFVFPPTLHRIFISDSIQCGLTLSSMNNLAINCFYSLLAVRCWIRRLDGKRPG